ncbi:ras-specific guanine nucleotide-releasing factor 2-like protein [Turdus rufiventris]|nr:ras-specific guanine nucleotide-releasing factor 2-like protein [Turdus rufiventris]
MQKSVRYNEGHALYLALLARKEGTKRGYLSKKTAETNRWHEKWFALYQNVLFYFEGEQSARPAGMYMLEGCNCERVAAPKGCAAGSARDAALDKQSIPRGSPGSLVSDSSPSSSEPERVLLPQGLHTCQSSGVMLEWFRERIVPGCCSASLGHLDA